MNPLDIPDKSLTECLALIQRAFDAEEIAQRRIATDEISEYYRQCDRGYRIFHSADGALHLALNHGKEFEFDGYAGQAEYVEKHLRAIDAQHVLEAGCGNGFNCICLAGRNPGSQFLGIDLTEQHVAAAVRASSDLDNANFAVGNYEELHCEDQKYDLVFAVETLCQTPDRPKALAELHRVLRPGGRLVVVDVFRNRPLTEFEDQIQLAAQLVEKTTSVDEFAVLGEFVNLVESFGFELIEQVDLTDAVAHNLERLYVLARRFFNMRAGVWAMKKTFGTLVLENAICGFLMPFSVGHGVHGYYSMAFEARTDRR